MSHLHALRRQSIAQRSRKSIVDDPRNLQRILQAELQDYSKENLDFNDPDYQKKFKIRKLRKAAKIVDTCSFVLATAGVVFATVDYELFYDDRPDKPHFTREAKGTVLMSFVSLTTALLMITMIIHSIISYKLEKLRNPLYKNVGYFRSKYPKQLIVEIIICGVHCPPGFDQIYSLNQLNHKFQYSLSGILLNCMFLRFYLFFRIFAAYSLWTSEMAQESCEPEGCQADTMFAIKAILKEKPYTALLMLMLTTTIVFGLVMRNFERPVYYEWDDPSTYQDFGFIWNGMWLIAITMTTVGYGDYFPRTHFGRVVAVIVSFWGVFLTSMMVVTLTTSSSFEPKEAKAYDILFRLNTKDQIKQKAASVITTVVRIVGNNKKLKAQKITKAQHKTDHVAFNNELTIKLELFRNAKSLLSDYEISPEEMLRQLSEKIDRDFEDLKDLLLSMVSLEKHLNEIEKSQNLVFSALNDTTAFTSNLQNQLIQL